MPTRAIIAAQLSTVHSGADALAPDRVAAHLERAGAIVPLDILAMGWTERPELFHRLTATATRPARQVFLWYPLLSDYPGFAPSHLVVNSRSEASAGWAGYAGTGIAESFRQACPNNPDAVATTLGGLERLMDAYAFDGVFLDKIRFPSPANGLGEVFSCFCPHCQLRAAERGLDLDEVRAALAVRGSAGPSAGHDTFIEGAEWLDRLVSSQPVLQRFLRFRADSITALVAAVTRKMRAGGRKVGLDVFTPGLAPLVGQDLAVLAAGADWIKPMIYRYGKGPANLRSEVPGLIRGLAAHLGLDDAAALRWAARHVPGLGAATLADLETAPPLELVGAETRRAAALAGTTPLYLGVESVVVPGTMRITPRQVAEIVAIGRAAGVAGFMLSWDLLHTPLDNLRPLAP